MNPIRTVAKFNLNFHDEDKDDAKPSSQSGLKIGSKGDKIENMISLNLV